MGLLKKMFSIIVVTTTIIVPNNTNIFGDVEYKDYKQPTEFKDIEEKVSYEELLTTILENAIQDKSQISLEDIFANLVGNGTNPNSPLPDNTGESSENADITSQPGSNINGDVTEKIMNEIKATGFLSAGKATSNPEVLKWKPVVNEMLTRKNSHQYDDGKINFDLMAAIISRESSGNNEIVNLEGGHSYAGFGLTQETGGPNAGNMDKMKDYIRHLSSDLKTTDLGEWLGSNEYRKASGKEFTSKLEKGTDKGASSTKKADIIGKKCVVKSLKELDVDNLPNTYESYVKLMINPYINLDYTISTMSEAVHKFTNSEDEFKKKYPYLNAIYAHNHGPSGAGSLDEIKIDKGQYVQKVLEDFGAITS